MEHTNECEDVKNRMEEIGMPKSSEGTVEYLCNYVMHFEMLKSLEM